MFYFGGLNRGSFEVRQPQRRLSDAEAVALVMSYQAGSSLKELAHSYGVHQQMVKAYLRRFAIPLRQHDIAEADLVEVIQLYENGWSLARLGEEFECDVKAVRRVLLKAGVKTRTPWER